MKSCQYTSYKYDIIVNWYGKKGKSLLFTFITQFTIEPVCTTKKASSIKSVTRLVVTVWTARVPTVFSIRLETCYNKIQSHLSAEFRRWACQFVFWNMLCKGVRVVVMLRERIRVGIKLKVGFFVCSQSLSLFLSLILSIRINL